MNKVKTRRILTALVVALAVVCLLAFAACSNKKGNDNDTSDPDVEVTEEHTHSYAVEWASDEAYHWHNATCEHNTSSDRGMHDWKEDTTLTVSATCQRAGQTVYTCADCGKKKIETVAQLSHNFSEAETVPPTCTEGGYDIQVCTNDGCTQELKSNYTKALGHDTTNVKATCSAPAICARDGCGAIVAPASNHTYELDDENSKAATCYEDGKNVYVCKECGDKYKEKTLKHNHFVLYDAVMVQVAKDQLDSNITVNAYDKDAEVCYYLVKSGKCENDGCDYVEKIATAVTEHVYVTTSVKKAATCSVDGEKNIECSVCKHQSTIPYKDEYAHSWVKGAANEGVVNYTCSHNSAHTKSVVEYQNSSATVPAATLKNAGEVSLGGTSIALDEGAIKALENVENVQIAADALEGEDLDNALKELESDVSFDKVYNLTMSDGDNYITNFDGTVTVSIPYLLGEGEDPDHIVIAYINGSDISDMEGVYSNGFVVFTTNHFSYYTVTRMSPQERCKQFGHNYVEIYEAPTCVLYGHRIKVCTRCGEQPVRDDIEPLQHDWDNTGSIEATCTTDGVVNKKCNLCGVEFNTIIKAFGHDWYVKESKTATCTEAGYANYECYECDAHYETTEPQKAHNFQTTVHAATCTESGYTEYVCLTCGDKTMSDIVEALGHEPKTTTVSPTCTEGGYTYTYCTRCDARIGDLTAKIDALGHNMNNGVCERCGEGCDHEYKAIYTQKVSCTEVGYTTYKCDKCGNTYDSAIVPATGHDWDIEECTRCHTVNPNMVDYYLNMLNTSIGGSLSISLTDIDVYVDEESYGSGSQVIIKELEDINLVISLSETGDIKGSGSGKIYVKMLGEEVTMGAKLIINEGKAYIFLDSESGGLIPSYSGVIPFENLIGMSGVTSEDLKAVLLWINTDIKAIVDGIINANKDTIATVLNWIMGHLFTKVKDGDNYIYTLDLSAISRLNEAFNTMTIDEIADVILGTEDSIDLLIGYIGIGMEMGGEGDLTEMTVNDAIDMFSQFGLNIDLIVKALDDVLDIAMDTSFGPMLDGMLDMLKEMVGDFDSVRDLADKYLKEFGDKKVVEFIPGYGKDEEEEPEVDQGEAKPAESDKEDVKLSNADKEDEVKEDDEEEKSETEAMIEKIIATVEKIRNMTVYEVIEMLMKTMIGGGSGNVEQKPGMKPDYAAEKPGAGDFDEEEEEREKSLYEMVSEYIEKYVTVIQDAVGLSITTDSKGNILAGKFVANVDKLYINSGDNLITTEEAKDTFMSIKAIADIVVSTSGTPDVEDERIAELYDFLKFTKNTTFEATGYSNIKEKYSENSPIYIRMEGRSATIYTDKSGNIVKVLEVREDVYRDVQGTYGNYLVCNEHKTSEVNEYNFDASNFMALTAKNYCGDWAAMMFVAPAKSYSENTWRTVYLNTVTGDVAKAVVNSGSRDQEHEEFLSYFEFYYNPVTKEFKLYDPHSYRITQYNNLKYSEKDSKLECLGYKAYICGDCGEIIKEELGHLGKEIASAELINGAGSTCKDGILVKRTCDKCHKVTSQYKTYYHEIFKTEEIYLKDYGSTCSDEDKLVVSSCPCGQEQAFYDYRHEDDLYNTYIYPYNGGRNYNINLPNREYILDRYNYYDYNLNGKNVKVNVVSCPVSDCGFNFAFYIQNEKDEKCLADVKMTLIMNVEVDHEKRIVTGGKVVKTLVYESNGYNHSYGDGVEAGVYEMYYCRDCHTLLEKDLHEEGEGWESTEEWDYAWDGSGKVTRHTKWRTTDTDKGYIREYWHYFQDPENVVSHYDKTEYVVFSGANISEYSYTLFSRYEDYDVNGKVTYWSQRDYDYPDGKYCQGTYVETNSYGCTSSGTVSQRHLVNEYKGEATCTQSPYGDCRFCGETIVSYTYQRSHSFTWNSQLGMYICRYCGLQSNNDTVGELSLEDLSYTSDNSYVIGYRRRTRPFSIVIRLWNEEGDCAIVYGNGVTDVTVETSSLDNGLGFDDYWYGDKRDFNCGKIIFPIADIEKAAKKLGYTVYTIQVDCALIDNSGYAFAIEIDPHKWVSVTTNEKETIHVCLDCVVLSSGGGMLSKEYGYLQFSYKNKVDDNWECHFYGKKNITVNIPVSAVGEEEGKPSRPSEPTQPEEPEEPEKYRLFIGEDTYNIDSDMIEGDTTGFDIENFGRLNIIAVEIGNEYYYFFGAINGQQAALKTPGNLKVEEPAITVMLPCYDEDGNKVQLIFTDVIYNKEDYSVTAVVTSEYGRLNAGSNGSEVVFSNENTTIYMEVPEWMEFLIK